MGKYIETDMSGLNLTNVRDFATYIALSANQQGSGGETALERLKETLKGRSWAQYCSDS